MARHHDCALAGILRQRLQAGRPWWLLIACAIVWLIVFASALHQARGAILLQAEQSAGNLAWVLESRLTSTFQRVESDMRQVARLIEAPALAGANAARERTRVEALLADHVADFPEVMRTTVFDAEGSMLYTTDSSPDRSFNVSDRGLFRRLKTNPGLGIQYSEVVAMPGDGRSTLVIGHALVAADGAFMGTLFTLLDLGHFQAIFESVNIGANGVLFVRRREDNRLVLRRPQSPTEVNRSLDSPVWRHVKSGEVNGVVHVASPVDRFERVHAFRTLPGHPFYVAVALADADILAGWRQQAGVVGSLAAASLVLFAILVAGLQRLERRRSAAVGALTRSEHELRVAATAFDGQEAMVITNEGFTVLRVNRAFSRVTGFSAEELIGQNAWKWHSDDNGEGLKAAQRQALMEAGVWSGEIRCRRKSGETFIAWLTISAVSDCDGRVTHHVASFTDVSEHKAAEERIHTLAFYDSLTRLPNRRLLMERLQHAMSVSERSGAQCALVFLDLDHFKLINDTRGHTVGDALLVATAERLRLCVRASDTVTRQGGDEFVIMLEGLGTELETAAACAAEVVEKIRLALSEPFMLEGAEHQGSASLGVCLFHGHEIAPDELLKRCDTAMYQAKEAGRNALRFFDPAMQVEIERSAALDRELRQAVALQQFELHYQVQVDRDGRAFAAEALLRWNHPLLGLVPPADFIPLAEKTGVIIGIGRWVLDAACDRLAMWAADPLTRNLKLAVNVSARQFQQEDFVDSVRASLLRSGARSKQLKLELTEGLVMHDVGDTIVKMEAIRAMGVAFSVDDFGTGYSSLAYLQRLPLTQLKIDRSFILGLNRDDQSAAIVRSIITLAKVLGLQVVAEGVETEAQRDVLYALGCDGFQGYLFARPLPKLAFIEKLEELRQRSTCVAPASGGARTLRDGVEAGIEPLQSGRQARRSMAG